MIEIQFPARTHAGLGTIRGQVLLDPDGPTPARRLVLTVCALREERPALRWRGTPVAVCQEHTTLAGARVFGGAEYPFQIDLPVLTEPREGPFARALLRTLAALRLAPYRGPLDYEFTARLEGTKPPLQARKKLRRGDAA